MSAVSGTLRTVAPGDLLEHIRKSYAVGGIELTMDLGGSRNLNLMITTGLGMLVVRSYRTGMSLDRLTAVQAVRRALSAGGVPASVVLRTRSGETCSHHEGEFIEVEEFVEHSAQLDSWSRLEVGLPVLGRAHSILRTLNVSPAGKKPPIANYLGTAEVQEWAPRASKRIEVGNPPSGHLRFARDSEALATRLYAAEAKLRGRLPVQQVHGNFWGANVLFRNRKVVLVADWDYMGEQPRIEDLALTLYYANSTLSADPLSDESIRRLRALVDAYDGQLQVHLTADERSSLPLAMARAPLAALRHIAQAESADEVAHLIERMTPDLAWATAVVDDLGRWREGFS
ncbi:MAG: phosphotransferase [Thermoplasmata archaeon]|nr:phosphotransferase [Thermoplasmata archaeon]